MNVFITWSGGLSHAVATTLREWLPSVIQSLKPFLSSEDIRKGQRWPQVIAEQLQQSTFGLVCLTKENARCHPWVHFEAGAIPRSVSEGSLATLLIDLPISELEWPLGQFQASTAGEEESMRQLLKGSLPRRLKRIRLRTLPLSRTLPPTTPRRSRPGQPP